MAKGRGDLAQLRGRGFSSSPPRKFHRRLRAPGGRTASAWGRAEPTPLFFFFSLEKCHFLHPLFRDFQGAADPGQGDPHRPTSTHIDPETRCGWSSSPPETRCGWGSRLHDLGVLCDLFVAGLVRSDIGLIFQMTRDTGQEHRCWSTSWLAHVRRPNSREACKPAIHLGVIR